MIDESLRSKLIGLRNIANAESAAQGERDNARRLYDRLLAKYNLTDADIVDELPDYVEFPFNNTLEKRLVIQIIARLTNYHDIQTYRIRSHRKKVAIKLTKRQGEVALIEYRIYRKALAKELERCFHAFVQVNKIFSTHISDIKLTPEEEAELLKIFEMEKIIKPTPIISGLLKDGGKK